MAGLALAALLVLPATPRAQTDFFGLGNSGVNPGGGSSGPTYGVTQGGPDRAPSVSTITSSRSVTYSRSTYSAPTRTHVSRPSYDPGLHAAGLLGSALGTALGRGLASFFSGPSPAELEARRQEKLRREAEERARQEEERRRREEEHRRRVQAWLQKRSAVQGQLDALLEGAASPEELSAMAYQSFFQSDELVSGSGGDLVLEERVGAFGETYLAPVDVASGPGDGAVRLPPGADTPTLLRSAYGADGQAQFTTEAPAQHTLEGATGEPAIPQPIALEAGAATPTGGVGLHAGTPDAPPPPNPSGAPAPEVGPEPVVQPSTVLEAVGDGVATYAEKLGFWPAKALWEAGKVGIRFLDEGIRQTERDQEALDRALRHRDAVGKAVERLRRDLAATQDAARRARLEEERSRMIREKVEMDRLLATYAGTDPWAMALGKMVNKEAFASVAAQSLDVLPAPPSATKLAKTLADRLPRNPLLRGADAGILRALRKAGAATGVGREARAGLGAAATSLGESAVGEVQKRALGGDPQAVTDAAEKALAEWGLRKAEELDFLGGGP